MVARVAAVEPFASAADLLADLAGIALTTKRVERCAEADGQAIAAALQSQYWAILDQRVAVLPPAEPRPDKLYLTIDGTGVPVVPAAAADRPGKAEDRRARIREVKLACLFTQTKTNDEGYPVRDPNTASYVGTFAPADQFATLVHTEARRRGAEHIRQLVVLGRRRTVDLDLATSILPEATQIVGPVAQAGRVRGRRHPPLLADRARRHRPAVSRRQHLCGGRSGLVGGSARWRRPRPFVTNRALDTLFARS